MELWLPSPVTMDILYLDPAQEPLRILETGTMQIQLAIKVITTIWIYLSIANSNIKQFYFTGK